MTRSDSLLQPQSNLTGLSEHWRLIAHSQGLSFHRQPPFLPVLHQLVPTVVHIAYTSASLSLYYTGTCLAHEHFGVTLQVDIVT